MTNAARFTVELVEPETTFTVEVDGRDIRRWEAEYDASFTGTPASATQTAQLAHVAALRQGLFDGPWDIFNMRCTHVVAAREVAILADPTPPGAMADF